MTLQEIRTRQALKELNRSDNFTFSHPEPWVKIRDEKYTLIFPQYMFKYQSDKSIDKLFIGLKTPTREKFLNNFPDATIIYSKNGRIADKKVMDEWYFTEMSKAKFVLCPNGDFIWTYRFFEAAIFKAIPIIEEYTKIYEGYKYYKKGDDYIYRIDWVEHNYNKVKQEMTIKNKN